MWNGDSVSDKQKKLLRVTPVASVSSGCRVLHCCYLLEGGTSVLKVIKFN